MLGVDLGRHVEMGEVAKGRKIGLFAVICRNSWIAWRISASSGLSQRRGACASSVSASLFAVDGMVWLTQAGLADLFDTTKQNVSLHMRNILAEGELEAGAVIKESLTTATDGKAYRTKLYNLNAILAVGYRVRSPWGTRFRR